VPPRVTIGLTDPQGVALDPTVQKGTSVRAGQVVARGQGRTGAIRLSPVSGTVEEVRSTEGGADGAITILSDGSSSWAPIERAGPEAAAGPTEVVERIVSQSGIPGIPTRFDTAAIPATDVEAVIINGVGADIYNPSVSLIAGSRIQDIASAVRILSKIYPAAALSLAVDARARVLGQQVHAAVPRGEIAVHFLKPKFPQHREEMLLPVILGLPFPHGHRAINRGVLVLDLQAALAIHDAVVHGKPAIDRIVALAGPGFTRNVHVRVRVGTAVSQVVDSRLRRPDGLRLVENSLLTGKQIRDPSAAWIGPQTDTLIAVPEKQETGFLPFAGAGFRKDSYSIAFASRLLPIGKEADTNLHGEERPCLSCGFCEAVCPARILPNVLHKYVKRALIDETLLRYRISRCFDCNLCTYVCTSKIDVASLLRQGKARLAAQGREILPEVPLERLKGILVKEPAK
jgi:electron transport complex protein RnfC